MTTRHLTLVFASLLLCLTAFGETITVGPSGTFLKPCQAFAAASSGDTILIDAAGNYSGDVCAITPSNLLIRGVNGRPRIDAAGNNAKGKAIWVVQGNDVIIENVEMLNCKVPDLNGAAVRAEGINLTLRWVYFHHNENGLLTGAFPGDILIEFSEFSYNGHGDGYSHNIYVGHQRSFTLRFSYIHHSVVGHSVKSRADETNLLYNRIMTEQSGTGSLEIDLPNGGKGTVVGNLVQQGQYTENYAMFGYANEGGYPVNTLRVANNTFVSQRSSGKFFFTPPSLPTMGVTSGLVINNIFQGNAVLAASEAMTLITFQNNLQGDAWLADLNNYDYRLLSGSPAINMGIAAPVDLVADWQYAHPACGTPRTASGVPDLGAYEANVQQWTVPGRCTISWNHLVPRLTLPVSNLKASGTIQARVTLNGLAPTGGAIVSLQSSAPDHAPVPATVIIPAGESTIVLPIDVSVNSSAADVTFTATLGGSSTTSLLKIASGSVALSGLALGVTSVLPPTGVTGQVTLSAPAPAGGAVIQLASSNSAMASVPGSVTVPAGATISPNFTITTSTVPASTSVTISALYSGATKTATLTVMSPAVQALTISPLMISGGKPITSAYVTLDSPAPAGGAVVRLTSTDAAAVPPPSVTVLAGAKVSPVFTISTRPVATATPVLITASYGGISKSITVNLKPTALYSLYLPTVLTSGGKLLNATVTLEGPAPSGGAVVTLSSSAPSVAALAATVTIASGASVSPAVPVSIGYVTVATPVVITATYGGVSKSVTVTAKPTSLSAFNLSTVPVSGGKIVAGGSIYTDGPAPPSGAVIQLTSSNPSAASAPATFTIPSGAVSAPLYSITTNFVSVATSVVITASYGGVSKSVTLTVKPTAISSVTTSALPVTGGKSITTAYISMDGPAPPVGAVVTLSSSNPAVAGPPTQVTVAAGKTNSAYFTISTSVVAATSQATITASYGGVSKSAVVTVNP